MAMEGIGTPESHDVEGGANTFGNVVYLKRVSMHRKITTQNNHTGYGEKIPKES
ncbi:unnamed protein product, partial [Staurois parvus]